MMTVITYIGFIAAAVALYLFGVWMGIQRERNKASRNTPILVNHSQLKLQHVKTKRVITVEGLRSHSDSLQIGILKAKQELASKLIAEGLIIVRIGEAEGFEDRVLVTASITVVQNEFID